ncbi:hypothetical protein AaE_010740, partial [Aphanomyces astaci]
SRSRSPKGKSKTVKVLDIKRANNIVMTLSDFEFHTQFNTITQAIVDMVGDTSILILANFDDQALTLEKVRCLKGLFPTDDEKDSLLARQADKGEFGKAEKFMMVRSALTVACLDVDDINVRADCFLFKLKMLDDKKQKVIWEDDKYTQLLDAGQMSGDIPLDQLDKLRRIESVPDISCLLRSELQEVLDSLINGCRACQNLLSQVKCNRLKAAEALPSGSTRTLMGIPAAAEFERFIKASVGDINDATDEFRQAKAWENKLVSEFGVVLEDFSPLEILCAVKQLLLAA